jgi:hypothetical protein
VHIHYLLNKLLLFAKKQGFMGEKDCFKHLCIIFERLLGPKMKSTFPACLVEQLKRKSAKGAKIPGGQQQGGSEK